jgi:hypothetical protein
MHYFLHFIKISILCNFFRDEEVVGVDPTIFRRFLREVEDEDVPEDDVNETQAATTTDKRTEVNDYKMPRRKTTRRKKGRRQDDTE